MGKLDGRVALITGASRGIGQAIAELYAVQGARIVCAARTLNEGDHQLEGSLTRTVDNIRGSGGEAIAVTVDISDEADCLRLVDQAKNAFGPVDILVNNAALNYYIPIVDYPTSRWMRSFAVNVHGPFMLSKAVLPDMIGRGRASAIINVSSGSAIGPGRGPYDDQIARGGDHVRRDKSSAGTLHSRLGPRGCTARKYRGQCLFAIADRADPRNRVSQIAQGHR
jgi:citronellol/citronellal dehydrogenase